VRGISASRILAATFTNKAASEMAGRIRATLGDGAAPHWIGTFHGLGARQLRIEPEVGGLRPSFDILDADDSRRIVKRVMKAMDLAGGDDATTIGRDPLKVMCNRLSKFKDSLITPEEAPAHVEAMIAEARQTRGPIDAGGLRASARVYGAYQRVLRDANAADFTDLLLWPTRAMQLNAVYRARWADRFDCVLADEYQDVNHAQYTCIRLLGTAHGEVFVVGDYDQSVYSVARIGYPFHTALCARLPGCDPDQAGGELPLDRAYSRCGERGHRAGPGAPRQNAVHPQGGWRSHRDRGLSQRGGRGARPRQ
jgi:DNA helicase-2/ATP-dependent DNA helicase PcrA